MKNERKHAWLFVQVLVVAALLFMVAPRLLAQTPTTSTSIHNNPATNFNPPPCDFTDLFYNENGVSTSSGGSTAETATGVDSVVAQRFGLFRQTGPPAFLPGQVNWKIDNTCTTRDPDRTNVRILATTGGYSDDGTGQPTHFISIIAFLTNQNFFETNFVSGDPSFDCSVPTPPALPTSGCVVINNTLNARNQPGDDMQDIVSNFEAYAANKQILPNGTFALTPCGTMGTGATPCFPVTSVATPALRQDWRFAVNRNAIDGSDGNVVSGTGPSAYANGANPIQNNSPYGYFCDDLLGMWIVTYFWYTVPPNINTQPCKGVLSMLAKKNGISLDGTPIIKTPDELNNDLEANGCGAEGNEDVGGTDGGAVWLICPGIPDPTNGGIALDAFLDQSRRPNGIPLDPGFTTNFFCLQFFGQFCSSLTQSQINSAQSQGAASQSAAASGSSSSN